MNEQEFYEQCAFLLGVHHEYTEPTPVPKMPDREGNIRNTYKARYNGRTPGNGRFPGSGIVRNFGTFIQVRLTTPPLHGNFPNFDVALEAITKAMAAHVGKVGEQIQRDQEQALIDNPVGYRIASPEEIDLSRRQLHRGNEIAAAMVRARMMTPEECAEMEAATAAVHTEISALLEERTEPTYTERRKLRDAKFRDGMTRWSCGHLTSEHTHDEARECAKQQVREAEALSQICPRCDELVYERCDEEICGYL